MAKEAKEESTEKTIAEIYVAFLKGLKKALEVDPPTDSTLKIATEFFKTQKVDFSEIERMLQDGRPSSDVGVAAESLPFPKK